MLYSWTFDVFLRNSVSPLGCDNLAYEDIKLYDNAK